MSLANKFNLKTAVEDIKEDLVVDIPPVVEEPTAVTEPVTEAVTEVANEGDTVDVLEASTPIPIEEGVDVVLNPEEDLEQVPDHTEEMEFMASEVNKGFEAIEQLSKIAKALEAQESKGVSLESYNDFALIALNQVRARLSMESEENDSTSEKTKSLISKIVEAIKKIFEKIGEFISMVIEKFKKYFTLSAEKTEDFLSFIKVEYIEKKVFTLTPRHYLDEENVTYDLVFNNSSLKNYDHNKEVIEKYFEELVDIFHKLKSKNTFNKKEEVTELLKSLRMDFYKNLKASDTGNSEQVKVLSPDGYALMYDDSAYLQYILRTDTKLDKQRIVPNKKEKLIDSVVEFNKKEINIRNSFFKLTDDLDKLINKEIKSELSKLDNYEEVDLYCFKQLSLDLQRFYKFYMNYIKDLISGPHWYMAAIREHYKK